MVHGCCLSTNDVEEVKLFIHEFCTRALLPYVERQIQNISESVSNKKGVSRSLFSATKRWFSPNKPGSTIPVNNVVYVKIDIAVTSVKHFCIQILCRVTRTADEEIG